MKKKLWITLGVVIALFLVITAILQFRTVVKNPPVTQDIPAPEDVKTILKRSCYDCHSNETRITWLQKLPIVSSIVASDVKKARSVLNFSTWDIYTKEQQRALLFLAVSKVKNGQMPPADYLVVHPSAHVTEQEKAILDTYLLTLSSGIPAEQPGEQEAYQKLYAAWNPIRPVGFKARNSPDGIPFPEEYRNWRPLAVSFRIDNGTIRLIVGNDIAIEAARHKQTNPWPDGSILGKVVWKQRQDPHWAGAIVPGELVHVEFMFKDKTKYASTYGWGWARWLGEDLVPFGDRGQSMKSCIECHTPVKQNDWVFTQPAIMP